ncbi:MAG: hypothetical protein C0506_01755 [Anaerolinea sp.]|nr:hypothetical protein [Anaerolinea sp.]
MPNYRLDLAVPGRDLFEQREFAALGEERGFRGAWVSEVNGADAVTQAAAIGSATTSARVGTAIVPIQTRDPLLMAQTATSLAELTDGRFVLGLGTSTKVIVEDWHGRPWGKPVSGTREYVRLMRGLLSGERVTADGPFPMRRASLSSRNPRQVPIHLAALNDAMLRLAGEIGDGAILNFVSPAQVRRSVGIMKEARATAGIDAPFEVSIYFRATVTDDPELALPRYQQELLTYVLAPVYQTFFARDGYAELCATTTERWGRGEREAALKGVPMSFIAERALIGTAASIRKQLEDYAAAGMDTAFIMPVPIPGSDYPRSCREMIEALGPGR